MQTVSRCKLTAQPFDGPFTQPPSSSDTLLRDPFELVIVAVKAYSTGEAVRTISSVAACSQASILTVQNGLGNEEELAEAFGADRVIAGALTVAVDRVDATTVAATKKGGLCISPVGRRLTTG